MVIDFKCSDLQEGDTLVCIKEYDCCWIEGREYEVKARNNDKHRNCLYVIASCGSTTNVGNDEDFEDENDFQIHEIFQLRSKSGPW